MAGLGAAPFYVVPSAAHFTLGVHSLDKRGPARSRFNADSSDTFPMFANSYRVGAAASERCCREPVYGEDIAAFHAVRTLL